MFRQFSLKLSDEPFNGRIEIVIIYLQDRADLLARNFWLKTYRRGNWEMINGMKKINRMECKDRLTNPRSYLNVFSSSFSGRYQNIERTWK